MLAAEGTAALGLHPDARRCRPRRLASTGGAPPARATPPQQSGLTERGFEVLRLNTYDTVPVASLDADVLEAAKRAAVVTVGSPSAIK